MTALDIGEILSCCITQAVSLLTRLHVLVRGSGEREESIKRTFVARTPRLGATLLLTAVVALRQVRSEDRLLVRLGIAKKAIRHLDSSGLQNRCSPRRHSLFVAKQFPVRRQQIPCYDSKEIGPLTRGILRMQRLFGLETRPRK